MKILIVSDSHRYDNNLERITQKYKNKVDYMVHCGDSSLDNNDPIITQYDTVCGNHDDSYFPRFIIHEDICITHGHIFKVYSGYDELVKLCQMRRCHICFHGHTHVPTHQIHNGIHFINPGSLMMNRGSYGYGTYAIADYKNGDIKVEFYHHKTDELCSNLILKEGLELLEQFKKIG